MKSIVIAAFLGLVLVVQANSDEEDLDYLIEEILKRHRIKKEFLFDEQYPTTTVASTTTTTTEATHWPHHSSTTPTTTTSKSAVPITTTTTQASTAARKVEVYAQEEEIWANTGKAAQLFCQYSLTSGEDRPVTITWKVGDGPRFATPIFVCAGWTHTFRQCSSQQIEDANYEGRIRIAQDTPSLEITNVTATDNRNYWCQVTVEEPDDYELEFDAQSMVLRIYDGGATPKFHSTTIDDDIVASVGQNITIDCACQRGYHCEDVTWYKGPLYSTDNNFDLVYTRTTHSRPVPTQYTAYNQWIGRSFLTGNALTIIGVQDDDSGRYWCELRSSGFYGIGELATDAESMVLEVRKHKVATEELDCLSKGDGIYTDPESCAQYYECFDHKTFHRDCPAGTVFNSAAISDSNAYVCDFVANVAPPCGSKQAS